VPTADLAPSSSAAAGKEERVAEVQRMQARRAVWERQGMRVTGHECSTVSGCACIGMYVYVNPVQCLQSDPPKARTPDPQP
jgi:hypothetical protein